MKLVEWMEQQATKPKPSSFLLSRKIAEGSMAVYWRHYLLFENVNRMKTLAQQCFQPDRLKKINRLNPKVCLKKRIEFRALAGSMLFQDVCLGKRIHRQSLNVCKKAKQCNEMMQYIYSITTGVLAPLLRLVQCVRKFFGILFCQKNIHELEYCYMMIGVKTTMVLRTADFELFQDA